MVFDFHSCSAKISQQWFGTCLCACFVLFGFLFVLPSVLSTSNLADYYENRLKFPIIQNCTVKTAIERTERMSAGRYHIGDYEWCAYQSRCVPNKREAELLSRDESAFFVWSRDFIRFEQATHKSAPDRCLSLEERENKTFPIRVDPKQHQVENANDVVYWSDFNGK